MSSARIFYIPHGGGPMPLMGHPGHTALVPFLQNLLSPFPKPEAIIVISAHWERDIPTITAGERPGLIYDYFGFPKETYEIQYPAPGAPDLAGRIHDLLSGARIKSKLDPDRGYDHGVFVPLTLMAPPADIPCIQISLTADLAPSAHLNLGAALSPLCRENLLILGSGFSFHNMEGFVRSSREPVRKDPLNREFQDWLEETCTDPGLGPEEVRRRLVGWEWAPQARHCHPREEHLLPLHVCAGMAELSPARTVFRERVMGRTALAFQWEPDLLWESTRAAGTGPDQK